MSNVWSNEEMFVDACGVHHGTKYSIYIPREIYDRFLTLLKEIDTEWLLYLTYTKEEKRDKDGKLEGIVFLVDGFKVPKQAVTSAHVKPSNEHEIDAEIETARPGHGPTGVIHAHQFTTAMPHFSGTDNDYVNSNNAFSMVINKNGEFEAVTKEKTPCGRWLMKKAEVFIKYSEYPDIVAQLKACIEKTTYAGGYGGYQRGDYEGGYPSTSGKRNKSSAWGTQNQNTTKLVKVITVKGKRIQICPHDEKVEECSFPSYYDCIYYKQDCPKKAKISGEEPKTTKEEQEQEEIPYCPQAPQTQEKTQTKIEATKIADKLETGVV